MNRFVRKYNGFHKVYNYGAVMSRNPGSIGNSEKTGKSALFQRKNSMSGRKTGQGCLQIGIFHKKPGAIVVNLPI